MSDDRTVDADDSTMDELRRLAAEARARQSRGDATVQADDSTMADLRRMAEEAKRQMPSPESAGDVSDRTVDADDAAMDELRRYAAEARGPKPTDVARPTDLPSPVPAERSELTPPEAWQARPTPANAPAPTVATPPAPARSAAPADDVTTIRTGSERQRDVSPPSASHQPGDAWRPPPRMVMPTEPEKHTHIHHGPWKTVSIVLAGLVAALVAFVAFGALTGGDDETPTDGTTPAASIEDAPEGGAVGG